MLVLHTVLSIARNGAKICFLLTVLFPDMSKNLRVFTQRKIRGKVF
jgi:hypothetical protein